MFHEEIVSKFRIVNPVYFNGNGATTEQITELENILNLGIPDSYRKFLLQYGSCRYNQLFGINEANIHKTTILTKNLWYWTEKGISQEWLVLMEANRQSHYWDDTVYCLDTTRMMSGECPVIQFSLTDGLERKFLCFFQLDRGKGLLFMAS